MSRHRTHNLRMLVGLLLITFVGASLSWAQEKSFVWVSSPLQLVLPANVSPQDLFDQENAVLYRSGALAFIRAMFGCKDGTPPQLVPCTSADKPTFMTSKDYVIIHVVRWKDPDAHSGAQSVDKENWYVFNHGDGDWDDDAYSKNNRILGSRRIYLVYVHFNTKTDYSARYTMTAKKKTPAYLLHFTGLLQLFGVSTTGGATRGITITGAVPNAVWGVKDLDAYYVPADLSFEPAMLPPATQGTATTPATTSTTPPPAASVAPAAAPANNAPTSTTLPPTSMTVPAGTQSNAPVPNAATTTPAASPATGTTAPAALTSEVKLDSHTFDNEGLYHIDFTVAVPIRKISEISYVSASNTLTPTKVDKQTTFGVVDYYFKPIDIKGSGWSLFPHALAGVAINSHPLKRVLIGGGYGPLLAHFYMGLVLDTQSLPSGGTCGKLPSASQLASGTLHNRTCPAFSLGLNVSVASILDSLKSKPASSSGSKAK